jgi:RNA polymerase sigma-54 factor
MPTLSLAPRTNLKPSPSVVSVARILELPAMALYHRLLDELQQNPALEEVDDPEGCECRQFANRHRLCLSCIASSAVSGIMVDFSRDGGDPFQFVISPQSRGDVLLSELNASLPVSEQPIAAALLECIDEHGFLTETAATIASRLRITRARVDGVLSLLRELTPPGFAAGDLRQSMLAQLVVLAEKGIVCPHAQSIVNEFLEDLGAHRHYKIARKLRISTVDVERVGSFLQRNLWPYPMRISEADSVGPTPGYKISPDLIIQQDSGMFTVEVLRASTRSLRINPIYMELAQHPRSLTEEERTHVTRYLDRAQTFLTNLRQRDNTLQRVAELLVTRQERFLRSGHRHLVPLTRRDLARDLDLHESTVSRAVLDKTALLPNGSLCPLSTFFDSSRAVQDVLRELVLEEQVPLTDHELAALLTDRGYPIARRTVAKYREQLRILPHRQRASRSSSER